MNFDSMPINSAYCLGLGARLRLQINLKTEQNECLQDPVKTV